MGDILDIGCGEANILKMFDYKIKNYVGIEYDSTLVEKLNEKYPDARFFQKDLDEDYLNLDMEFDAILLISVIEHILNLKHLLKECRMYLKPNGKIIIVTPTVTGNDIVHSLGAILGLFSKHARDDHIVIFNRKRLDNLATTLNLRIEKYRKFELGCNQLVILTRNCP
ncbi:MAG: class I SAM-dependent methyltransferase [Actinomycetota bacterium]|nr:class I SAM-dependent methyltransferase [Actinomycetota bacterium]